MLGTKKNSVFLRLGSLVPSLKRHQVSLLTLLERNKGAGDYLPVTLLFTCGYLFCV